MEKIVINKTLFGQRLKQLMKQSKENNKSMAEKFGLTSPTFSRYIRGEMCPKVTTLLRIAEYFQVNPLWLSGQSLNFFTDDMLQEGERSDHIDAEITVYDRIIYNIPIFSNQKCDEKLHIPREKLIVLSPVIGYRVSDDSMAPQMQVNDLILIKLGTDLVSGNAVALHMDQSDMMIRKLILTGPHHIILQPLNGNYPAEYYDLNKHRLQIIGQVVYIEHSEKTWLL